MNFIKTIFELIKELVDLIKRKKQEQQNIAVDSALEETKEMDTTKNLQNEIGKLIK